MEPLAGEAGPLEELLEATRDVRAVEPGPDRRGEHEIALDPAGAGPEALAELTHPMGLRVRPARAALNGLARPNREAPPWEAVLASMRAEVEPSGFGAHYVGLGADG